MTARARSRSWRIPPAGSPPRRSRSARRIGSSGSSGQRATRSGALDGYRVWVRDTADLAIVAGPSRHGVAEPAGRGSPKSSPGAGSPATMSIARALKITDQDVAIDAIVTVAGEPARLDRASDRRPGRLGRGRGPAADRHDRARGRGPGPCGRSDRRRLRRPEAAGRSPHHLGQRIRARSPWSSTGNPGSRTSGASWRSPVASTTSTSSATDGAPKSWSATRRWSSSARPERASPAPPSSRVAARPSSGSRDARSRAPPIVASRSRPGSRPTSASTARRPPRPPAPRARRRPAAPARPGGGTEGQTARRDGGPSAPAAAAADLVDLDGLIGCDGPRRWPRGRPSSRRLHARRRHGHRTRDPAWIRARRAAADRARRCARGDRARRAITGRSGGGGRRRPGRDRPGERPDRRGGVPICQRRPARGRHRRDRRRPPRAAGSPVSGRGPFPLDPGAAGLGTLLAISAASLAITVLRRQQLRRRMAARIATRLATFAAAVGGPRGRPAGADPSLSVGHARSTRLDARENAGLSSAEFRASEAAP